MHRCIKLIACNNGSSANLVRLQPKHPCIGLHMRRRLRPRVVSWMNAEAEAVAIVAAGNRSHSRRRPRVVVVVG